MSSSGSMRPIDPVGEQETDVRHDERWDDEEYDAPEDEDWQIIKGQRERIRSLEQQLADIQALDTHQRILELQEALDMATGPHCSSCGQAIDPDCCWCGSKDCNQWNDGHSFTPNGCICGFAQRDWPRLASGLREELWRERAAHATALEDIKQLHAKYELLVTELRHQRDVLLVDHSGDEF